MKEEEHLEAVIKDEVICTSAHKNLCLYIFLCVETPGKDMLRTETLFCAAGLAVKR